MLRPLMTVRAASNEAQIGEHPHRVSKTINVGAHAILWRSNVHILTGAVFVVFLAVASSSAQTFGTAKVPGDLLKATLGIETAETKTNTVYVPSGLFVVSTQPGKTIQVTSNKLVVELELPQTTFRGIGSGVLLTKSNVNLFVTAKHVVQPNEDVFFRIPQKTGTRAAIRSHALSIGKSLN